MSRLIRLKDRIERVLIKDSNKNHQINRLSSADFDILSKIAKVLKPFNNVTEVLSAEKYVSRSLILPSKYYLDASVRFLNSLNFFGKFIYEFKQ